MPDGTTKQAQVVVIGGGPGGYAAAFHAADLGLHVTLIDEDPRIGGVCLHRGCIPSKALLHVAKLLHEARDASRWGVRFGEPEIDLEALRSWKDAVVDRLAGGVEQLAERRNVEVLRARARFADSHTLDLERSGDASSQPSRVQFGHAIVAVGSLPAVPPAFQTDDPRVMDSTRALALERVPDRLLVVGGGYIGLEMGSVFASLGSKVTLVELTGGLLPGADRDLVRPLAKRLGGLLESVYLNTKVEGLRPESDGIVAILRGPDVPEEVRFDNVLVAIGRRPRGREVGLENTSAIVNDRGFIQVDDRLRTADPKIFAVGDSVGEPMLAHKATHEGRVAAEVIAGLPAASDNVAIPAVVFTDPEVAWCGLTEEEAKRQGREVAVTRFPWSASGRALTLDRPEGMSKLLIDPRTERVLGMGVVGPGAGELIAEGVLAVETAAVARDVADSIHAHPTLSETVGEAAEAFFGHATHLWRPARGRKR